MRILPPERSVKRAIASGAITRDNVSKTLLMDSAESGAPLEEVSSNP
jgi:hypothetical protein